MEKNLDEAIGLLKAAKVRTYLVQMKMPPNYGGPFRKQFEATFSKLAKKHQIKLIPFFLEGVAGLPSMNQKDGIHPNAQGQSRIAENLYQFLKVEL
jgi:acyl-CoA thioesterase-1